MQNKIAQNPTSGYQQNQATTQMHDATHYDENNTTLRQTFVHGHTTPYRDQGHYDTGQAVARNTTDMHNSQAPPDWTRGNDHQGSFKTTKNTKNTYTKNTTQHQNTKRQNTYNTHNSTSGQSNVQYQQRTTPQETQAPYGASRVR